MTVINKFSTLILMLVMLVGCSFGSEVMTGKLNVSGHGCLGPAPDSVPVIKGKQACVSVSAGIEDAKKP